MAILFSPSQTAVQINTPVVFTDVQKNRFLHCSLCKQVYTVPVILISCGHTYCRSCLISTTYIHNEEGFDGQEAISAEAVNGKTASIVTRINSSGENVDVRCPIDGSVCDVDKLVINRYTCLHRHLIMSAIKNKNICHPQIFSEVLICFLS